MDAKECSLGDGRVGGSCHCWCYECLSSEHAGCRSRPRLDSDLRPPAPESPTPDAERTDHLGALPSLTLSWSSSRIFQLPRRSCLQ